MEYNTDKNTDKRLENLNPPWKEGDPSPNPNGRPKGQRNYATIYKEALLKLAELNGKTPDELETEIISKGLLSARGGDFRFYKDVLDRIHGQAIQKQQVEVTTPQPLLDVLRNNNSSKEDIQPKI